MTFGDAIEAMKRGARVQREGWNGKDMHLYLERHLAGSARAYAPCVVMYTAQGVYQPGWLASQTDMLAEDWRVVVVEDWRVVVVEERTP